MKASDFDKDVTCTVCAGDGTAPSENDARDACPRCGGSGTINRYRDGPDGEIVIREEYREEGPAIVFGTESMPVTSEDTGGFDGRFGDWVPEDLTTGPMADYQSDVLDRLGNNPLSKNTNTNGEYELPDEPPYHGKKYGASDLKGGNWPKDCADCTGSDPCPGHVVTWLQARGDDATASVIKDMVDEAGL